MQYSFTAEQSQLRETVSRFLDQNSPTTEVRRLMETASGHDANVWPDLLTNVGVGGINVAEDFGGAGLGHVELGIVLEEMGRYLFCSPFLSSNAFATTCIDIFGTDAQKQNLLPEIISGKKVATFTWCETNGDISLQGIRTTVGTSILNGSKKYVSDGLNADVLIVPARGLDSNQADEVGLFVVESSTRGLNQHALHVLDPTRKLTEVTFEKVSVTTLGDKSLSHQKYREFYDICTIALANEMVGGAQRMFDSAVAYANERVQFGRSISSLQAIKHKCAELLLEVEFAKSATYRAAHAADDKDPGLSEYASIAKVVANDTYMKAATECIQIHGGIGFTW